MSEAEQATGGREEIWLEKYRPQTLDEVVGHEAIIERLKSYVERDDLNHMLFAGPAGVGKTTSSIAIARELYGEDWEQQFLELNASDERGIDVVRERVKSFARTSFGGPSYRIIFLDEADALTAEAQAALRRTMEQFSNNVRFILSCNYSSQIIDPIQSRCTVFRFAPLSEEAVYTVTATARPEEVEEMVAAAVAGDFPKARATLDTLLTDVGMAGGDIIDQLHRSAWEFDLDDRAVVRLLERLGEADYRIAEGANEQVQLEALLAALSLDGE